MTLSFCFFRINPRGILSKESQNEDCFDVILEILQSARSMHFLHVTVFLRLFRAGFIFAGAVSLLAQQNELLPATVRGSGIPPTAGIQTNSVPLTVTNFVAGSYVTNGV